MDQEEIKQIIEDSCTKLLLNEPELFNQENDINERTVSSSLSNILNDAFPGHNASAEYNRMTDENGIQIPKRIHLDPDDPNPTLVYPDIIVHRHGDGNHNLLIIEIKMTWKSEGKESDIEKLNSYIIELGYSFGLYLELGEGGIVEEQWFG